jgi:hypothetical protein
MAAGEPQFNQALDYDAKQLRQMLAMLLNSRLHTDLAPAVSLVSAGGGHGVVGSGDLAVTEKSGTPNMSVDVAAGSAYIRGTTGADQGVYGVTNDAVVNVVIAAADATNARKDLIVARVRDAAYSGANNDVQITVIQGTPAASPADPTVTDDTLVLARVDVPALDTAITNSQITDLRTRAAALGAPIRCTSTTRPTSVDRFQQIIETDTGKELTYYGATTGWQPAWNQPWGIVTNDQMTADVAAIGTGGTNILTGTAFTAVANRRYRISAKVRITTSSTGLSVFVTLTEVNGPTTLDVTGDTIAGVTQQAMVRPEYVGTLTAGTRQMRLNVATNTGTVTAAAGATFPTFITVEDIGPLSSNAPAS